MTKPKAVDVILSAEEFIQIGKRMDSLLARADAAEREVVALRDTNRRLNERAQRAEGIVAKSGIVEGRPQGAKGRSFGRALANYAAAKAERERDEARGLLREADRELYLPPCTGGRDGKPCDCLTARVRAALAAPAPSRHADPLAPEDHARLAAQDPGRCVCGDRFSPGVTHRTDGPCFHPPASPDAAPVDMHLRYHDAYFAGRRLRGQGVAVEACPWPEGTRGINGARRIAWLRGWADGGA